MFLTSAVSARNLGPMRSYILALVVLVGYVGSASAFSDGESQLELGRKALGSRTGCFLVDYSFVETEGLKPGYSKDNRVYDVNREKSVKEWIFAEDLSPTRVKLQHVLFASELTGKQMEGSMLKHTGEDWQFNAPFLYDYAGHMHWNVKDLKGTPNLWTRRVTSLDDGLRYQCAAAFEGSRAYADWSCQDYAPIPGRETRDMKRKDYGGLDRTSRVINYGVNWLERERNVKIVEEGDKRIPLAKELGKTWYVRLPDTECAQAQTFVTERLPFWLLLQETWDEVLTGKEAVTEPEKPAHPSRYERVMEVEEKYVKNPLTDQAVRAEAKATIRTIITSPPAQ